jgi:hypothetical protein
MRLAKNRSSAALLGLLGACGISAALADPPASPAATAPAATQASATTSTPVASANAASAAAKPDANADAGAEKQLLASGYKPEMRNGTKVWCRREGELGSRLGGQKVCGTPQELKVVVRENQELVEKIQKTSISPSGK